MCVLLRLPGRGRGRGRPESLPEYQGIPSTNVIARDRNHWIVLENGFQRARIPKKEKVPIISSIAGN